MSLKAFELRKAIWAHLSDRLSGSVYSHVPQDAAFPYVRLGSLQSIANNTKSHLMREYTLTINVFDKDVTSTQTVEDLLHEVAVNMERQAFNLDFEGGKVIEVELEFEQTIQMGAPTDHYYNGIQRYKLIVMED